MSIKKTIVAALATSFVSGLAFAGGFDGPFVQLGIGGSSTSTKTSGIASESGASINGTSTQSSFNGLVSAGYSQSIGSQGFNLAANMFYVIGNQNAGNPSSSATNSSGFSSSFNANYKLKNTFGISVEPGWNFTDQTLGYVKLAWVNTQTNNSISYTNSDPDSSSLSYSKNINGFGYGLGVKQLLTKNIYAAVDLMGVSYSSNKQNGDIPGASFRPTQFLGFASVGYKF